MLYLFDLKKIRAVPLLRKCHNEGFESKQKLSLWHFAFYNNNEKHSILEENAMKKYITDENNGLDYTLVNGVCLQIRCKIRNRSIYIIVRRGVKSSPLTLPPWTVIGKTQLVSLKTVNHKIIKMIEYSALQKTNDFDLEIWYNYR